jgi:probable rRNA maturation factor
MQVLIRKEVRGHRKALAQLEPLVSRLFRKLIKTQAPAAAALKKAELSILITTDKKIRVLNREWRQKDKATDVLSFPAKELGELKALGRIAKKRPIEPWILGDIVISLETAKRQAPLYNNDLQGELERLVTHGLLHLLGYDHELSPKEEKRMQRMERLLLTR